MKSEFKFALLALVEAVACVGLVGCGGSGEEPTTNGAQVQSSEDGIEATAAAEGGDELRQIQAATTWTKIAGEGQAFSVTGTKTVRFGIDTRWVTKTMSGSGECTYEFFGSDPAVGRGKTCEVSSDTAAAAAPAPAPAPAAATGSWTTVAQEYKSFTLATAATVRFGVDDKWVSKSFTAGKSIYCGISTFGSDPAPTRGKSCQVQSTSAPAPAPAPTPAPAPAPTTGSAAIAWVAPTKNADGSALSDLAGFRIYYGTSSGTYSKSITISSPYTTNYTISNLPASTYYIIVKAYDTSNNESAGSTESTKTIK